MEKPKCPICGQYANTIHHIDFDKSNNNVDNILFLCLSCHTALHQFLRQEALRSKSLEWIKNKTEEFLNRKRLIES